MSSAYTSPAGQRGTAPRMRHVPPVAVPIRRSDVRAGLAALREPERAFEAFTEGVQAATGSTHRYLVNSGRAALTLILLGLKELSQRSRVIVPAYGCPTVVQSVLRAGLTPVFCDVDPHTLDLNRQMLWALLVDEAAVRDTLAVVAVHLYGLAQDVDDVVEFAHRRGIFVIEDAAQAFGARVHGRMVGTRADAGFYSLGRGKGLPVGHGGVIVAADACAGAVEAAVTGACGDELDPAHRFDVASLVRLLGYGVVTHPRAWWFLVRSPLNPADAGMNAAALPPIRLGRLSAVQAGVGAAMLARLADVQAVQRRHARQLTAALAEAQGVSVPRIAPGAEPAFLRLPIVADSKARAAALFEALAAVGIGVSRSYRRSLPDLFADTLATDERDFPGAQYLAHCLLTLPTNPYLTEEDVARIAVVVHDVLRSD